MCGRRALLLQLVGDEAVALVEEQNTQLLLIGERHGGAAIVKHARPGGQNRPILHLPACEPLRGGLDDLELGNGGLAQTLDLGEALRRCADDLGERAEARDQVLGERLDVAPL